MQASGPGMARRTFLAGAAATAATLSSPPWLRAASIGSSLQLFSTDAKQRHQLLGSQSKEPFSGSDAIVIDAKTQYQPVLGFGSALTDASCYLLNSMEPLDRKKFIAETYSPDAMGLNCGRVAIGSSDYSRSLFNYDDVADDMEMKHFSIEHDEAYILPMLREIRSVNPALSLLATPWSPPGWMKTYGSMLGGWMSSTYLEPYAKYFVRFLQAYAKAGVRIDAVTSQNELETDQGGSMPATFWTPEMEESFIRDHLGPMLRKQRLETQIWLLDHNYDLWKRVRWQLRDTELRKYISGVAWHGYLGTPDMMSRLHDVYPDVPFFWTEGGPDVTDPNYATEWTRWGRIFTEAMKNWCRGLITWNLMLDPNGDPNIGPFRCAGLVTLKSDHSVVQSGQYWALRHFSQHVKRGAVRVASHSDASELFHISFGNPDGSRVLILTNTGAPRSLSITDEDSATTVTIAADSVTTVVWQHRMANG